MKENIIIIGNSIVDTNEIVALSIEPGKGAYSQSSIGITFKNNSTQHKYWYDDKDKAMVDYNRIASCICGEKTNFYFI